MSQPSLSQLPALLFSWCKAVFYRCHTYRVCFSLGANYRMCAGPLRERPAGAAPLLFHHTRTFLTTRTGIKMELFEKRGLSDGQTYVLNIVILMISILSTTGAGWIILSFIVCSPKFILRCPTLLMVLAIQISEDFQTPIDPVSNFMPSTSSPILTKAAASPPATSLWRLIISSRQLET